MPHIPLTEGVPGIRALFQYRPETAAPMMALVEVLLRGPSTLSRGERELVAAYVSSLNGCNFCRESHAAFARAQLEVGVVVDATLRDPETAPLSEKLKALLVVARNVQRDARTVTADDVARARERGATDREIHDVVLIAAAFCMFNRYVDGLATVAPPDRAAYDAMAKVIVEHGYVRPPPTT